MEEGKGGVNVASKRWFKLRKGRWKISIIVSSSFVLLITLPLCIITAFAVESFKDIWIEQTTVRSKQALTQLEGAVDAQTKAITNSVATIANDADVISAASYTYYSEDRQERLSTSRLLESQLHNYFHYTSDVATVLFFYKDKGIHSTKENWPLEESLWRSQDWYEKAKSRSNKVVLMGTEQSFSMIGDEQQSYVTAAIAPSYGTELYGIEMILFVFHSNKWVELMTTDEAGVESFVIDKSGFVIASSVESTMQTGMDDHDRYLSEALATDRGQYITEDEGEEVLVMYETADNGWKYAQVLPYAKLVQQLDGVYWRVIGVSVAGLLIFLAVSYFFAHQIVKPIRSLVGQMSMVKMGNMKAKIVASGPFEIYALGNSFNDMVGELNEYIRQIEEKEKQKRLTEIAALQSQINPHFLLNTLNTIKLMAVISKVDNIQRMTELLSKLLSASFNRGGMYTTVEDELMLTEYYLQIMKIRYGDGFDVEINIDKEAKGLYMLKLLLQPIVENAIVHGLHHMDKRGLLRITCSILPKEKRCLFTIEDNGRGMTLEEIEKIWSGNGIENSKFNGIGLRNVNDRLQLNYGFAYGAELISEVGKGSTVYVSIPLLQDEPEVELEIEGDERFASRTIS